jgi:aminocarboxymuconate-semialdehyde decarboxylase
MIDHKNRYGRTAARIHDADGLARRPSSPTIDIHAHIVVPQAAKLAQPHVDISRIPLAHFSDAASKETKPPIASPMTAWRNSARASPTALSGSAW